MSISLRESTDSLPPGNSNSNEERASPLLKSSFGYTSPTFMSSRSINNSFNTDDPNDPNSPKFLTSSHSNIKLPNLSEQQQPYGQSHSETNSPTFSAVNSTTSPKRLLGFFSKSSSFQSLLNNSNGSNSSGGNSNNNSQKNIINGRNISSSSSSNNSVGNNNSNNNNNNYNSESPPPPYSPKRILRNEKAKSSPPLSPIPFSSVNNSSNNDNDDSTNSSYGSTGIDSSLFKKPSLFNTSSHLIPNIDSLRLDDSLSSSPPTTTTSNNNNNNNNSESTNNVSGTSSNNSQEDSPKISPRQYRPTLTRTRSNSKNVLYSPNISPSSSCKLFPSPTSPISTNNITSPSSSSPMNSSPMNSSPQAIRNNSNSQQDDMSGGSNSSGSYNRPSSIIPQSPTQNNNSNNSNLILTPQQQTSPPMSIPTASSIVTPINNLETITEQQLLDHSNHNIDILHINNNYIVPSPSPSSKTASHYPPVSIVDFKLIEKIGEGGFGQVFLAKKNDTGEIVALKRMSKDLIWSKNKVSHIKNERDILAQGRNHQWIVSLAYSFQDEQYLYLAMEYVPGGDLRSLLSALVSLDEKSACFYMAEMVEAVDSCHQLGYCHRDLKPENFLINKYGHIKLADFGLSKNVITRYSVKPKGSQPPIEHTPMKFNNNGNALNSSVVDFGSFKDINAQAQLAYSVVGSPFYMAPEVLEAVTGYGDEVDWWSLGCMFYEFIFGVPPFDGDSPEEVMETVLKWKTMLVRPEGVSDLLWDLISSLVCDGSTRLGTGEKGVENIKAHPFFKDVPWGRLHQLDPPFVPVLNDEYDTTYFENTEKVVRSRSPVIYTNTNSGNIVTSKTKPRNILGFTYPRAGDEPLIWNNMNINGNTSNINSSNSNNQSTVNSASSSTNSSLNNLFKNFELTNSSEIKLLRNSNNLPLDLKDSNSNIYNSSLDERRSIIKDKLDNDNNDNNNDDNNNNNNNNYNNNSPFSTPYQSKQQQQDEPVSPYRPFIPFNVNQDDDEDDEDDVPLS
ncbi:hypothetical protein CYY_008458 [Polysphondylium violaceum]|uniref:non-specific serine/threonine protein kinase n=1 Tax=Polysphondylium violaceum TaxID=133409 RepID=A0A8J4PN03_9MYCE|nr:hypothetical protein CYY_008458 [Polysphondylium violaceum]